MSQLFDRLNFLQKKSLGTFAGGHGHLTRESRDWEEVYRNRWRHDKIVRSTHGVNCTGSCSWKIYVKSGIVTWETQQTDYPRTRPDLPNHEPRGCSRGASLQLVSLQRQPTEDADGPQAAAAGLAEDARDHDPGRGLGGDPGRSRRCGSPMSRSVARAASCAPAGTRRPRSSRRRTPTPPRSTAPTGCSASRRSRRCRW
jgi:hypothetical protein